MNKYKLLVGNIIKTKGGHLPYWQITEDDLIDILKSDKEDIYEGVPLNEDWLLRFGMQQYKTEGIASFSDDNEDGDTYWWELKINDSDIIQRFDFCIVRWGEQGDFTFSYQNLRIKIRYVHQLQNLYFGLTCKELELKEK